MRWALHLRAAGVLVFLITLFAVLLSVKVRKSLSVSGNESNDSKTPSPVTKKSQTMLTIRLFILFNLILYKRKGNRFRLNQPSPALSLHAGCNCRPASPAGFGAEAWPIVQCGVAYVVVWLGIVVRLARTSANSRWQGGRQSVPMCLARHKTRRRPLPWRR